MFAYDTHIFPSVGNSATYFFIFKFQQDTCDSQKSRLVSSYDILIGYFRKEASFFRTEGAALEAGLLLLTHQLDTDSLQQSSGATWRQGGNPIYESHTAKYYT